MSIPGRWAGRLRGRNLARGEQFRISRRRRRLGIESLEPRVVLTSETEPNDARTTANAFVSPADTLDGAVATTSDQDFFQVSLTQGQTLTVKPSASDIFAGGGPNDSGQLHYAPEIQIQDSAGRLRGSSSDGHAVSYMAAEGGPYYVRVGSNSAFGPFTGGYRLLTSIANFTGVLEAEPNGTAATATAVGTVDNFRGTRPTAGDIDFFSFSGVLGRNVSIKFSNEPARNPTVRLHAPNGTVIATDLTGIGLNFVLTATGTHTVELRGDNAAGAVTGDYAGQVLVGSNPTTEVEPANTFVNAPPWSVSRTTSRAAGTLSSLTDVDLFAVAFDPTSLYEFQAEGPAGDLAVQSRRLELYNEFGQLIESSHNGKLKTRDEAFDVNPRPEKLARHFLAMRATGDVGLGAYSLTGRIIDTMSPQRDVPLFFHDFTNQTDHLNCTQVTSFTRPDTVSVLEGMFESGYDIYDVDLTQANPGHGTDNVAFGMRDFDCVNNSGLGSGSAGVRRATGDSLFDATGTGWTGMKDVLGVVGGMMHENGHALGVPHARHPLDFMGYDTQARINVVGSYFPFPATDSRVPATELLNKRDYLDWTLQAGRIGVEVEPNGTLATAQSSDPLLAEMSLELPLRGAYGAGTNPQSVARGDFNGDGRPDLVVANDGLGGMQILLGNADGSFQAPLPLAASAHVFGSRRVAVGDMNGDSKADLVWANNTTNNVSVLLGNGNGTFQAAANYAAGSSPIAVQLADFNGDGKLDVAVSNGSWHVNVLRGNGNGTLQAATAFSVAGYPTDIVAADLNGDNRAELITANNTAGNVSVLVNNGTGGFAAAVNYAVGPQPWAIASGDFNGDGKSDIAVSDTSDATVRLRLGNGNGTLQTPTSYGVGDNPYSLSAGDLNGDLRADLVVTSYTSAGYLQVLPGHANGTFGSPIRFAGGFYPVSSTVGDFNGDTQPDVVAINFWSHDVSTLLKGPNTPRNDRAVWVGRVDNASDADIYSFTASAGEMWTVDIDSAEFQNPLDSALEVLDSSGTVVAQNSGGRDGDTGLDSVDPYLRLTLATAGTYSVRVSSQHTSFGEYRLKLTPQRAFDTTGPRVLGTWPDGGATIDGTRQITFWLNDQVDPATATAANVIVQGVSSGVRAGSVVFDPVESTLLWTANVPLPADAYTVTLQGGVGGFADLRGNRLDGETDGTLNWPEVSGNGTAGGNFVTGFTVNANDAAAANVWLRTYRRHPYNRGLFQLWLDDEIDSQSVMGTAWTLRGAGTDGQFQTSDDTTTPLDVNYDRLGSIGNQHLDFFSRGTPDSDTYRLEGSLLDAAGNNIPLSEVFYGPNQAVSDDYNSTTDATFAVDVPNGTYDVTVTLGDPLANQGLNKVTYDDGVYYFAYVTGTTTATLKRQVIVTDGRLNTRLEGDGGAGSHVSLNALDLVKVGGTAFERHFDFGTSTSPLATGFTRITESTSYTVGTGYGWSLGTVTSNNAPGVNVCGGFDFGCSQIVRVADGPVVADLNVQPNSVVTTALSQISVTFGGSVNPTSLTATNFQVRYSTNSTFFDSDDAILAENDGVIDWDTLQHRATWKPLDALANGNYLIELKGDSGGIVDPNGLLLDGEYLDSNIAGNTTPRLWRDAPSGDGLPGGDYRAMFMLDVSPLDVKMNSISTDGFTTVTLNYTIVNGPAPAFDIGVYRSTDSVFAGTDEFLDSVTISAPGDLSTGSHTRSFTVGGGSGEVALPGVGATETAVDYYLLAVADPTDLVCESDVDPFADDNTSVFAGAYHAAAGSLLVHGRDLDDTLTLSPSGTNLVLSLNGSNTTYLTSDVASARLRAHAGNDTVSGTTVTTALLVIGGAGNDTLQGGAGGDTLEGGAGNDTWKFVGTTAADVANVSKVNSTQLKMVHGAETDFFNFDAPDSIWFLGGVGNDTLTIAAGIALPARLEGESGNDILTGGDGNDTIDGGDGADTVKGKLGSDTIAGGTGVDAWTIDGTNSNEFFDIDWATATSQLVSNRRLTSGGTPVETDVASAIEKILHSALGGNDVVDLSAISAADYAAAGLTLTTLDGGAGNDTIYGSQGTDLIKGNAGNDTLQGNGGADTWQYSGTSAADDLALTLIATDQAKMVRKNVGSSTILETDTYTFESIDLFEMLAQAGNDAINIDPGLGVPSVLSKGTLDGGTGTDTCSAPSGWTIKNCP